MRVLRGRRRRSCRRCQWNRGRRWRRTPKPGAKRSPSSPTIGVGINTQLAQARELEAKLAEEYR
jgi:hypothetical protein